MSVSQSNQDLIWKIGNHQYAERSVQFLKRFESALCLFSNTVAQLYSNYEMVPVSNGSKRIVALPNPHAYHDTFNHVDGDAIVPTGIRIIPSELAKQDSSDRLSLLVRSKAGKVHTMPLRLGIEKLEQHFGCGNFLPVMINKDLQMINGQIPAMHLHRVNLDKLSRLSQFQRSDIKVTIKRKMAELAA